MLRGEILFSNKETDLALKIYTEVLNLFPDVLEAYEMRAQCYLIGVREKLFNKRQPLYLLKHYQLIITQWCVLFTTKFRKRTEVKNGLISSQQWWYLSQHINSYVKCFNTLLDQSSYNPTSHKATTIRTLTRRAQLVCDSPDSLQDETDYLNNVLVRTITTRTLLDGTLTVTLIPTLRPMSTLALLRQRLYRTSEAPLKLLHVNLTIYVLHTNR